MLLISTRFKLALYAESTVEFEEMFKGLLDDEQLLNTYLQFSSYLKSVYRLQESRGLSCRNNLMIRGYNTSNNVEAQFLIVKDIILQGVKEYNINERVQHQCTV